MAANPKSNRILAANDAVSRPVPLPVIAEGIPQTMKARKQWVCWRYSQKNGKWTKPPFSVSGGIASTTNPETWSTFDDALSSYKTNRFDGIGFVLSDGDGLAGIDLDHCFNDGQLSEEAQEIVDQFQDDAYIERSPGRDGVRLFLLGSHRRSGKGHGKDCWVEAYDFRSPRYLTVTGHRMGGREEPQECPDGLDWLHEHYLRDEAKPDAIRPEKTATNHAAPESDAALIARMRSFKNQGQKFVSLFDHATHYNDDGEVIEDASAADMALVELLAFGCSRDAAQMDRIFRRSALMRDKWDEQHSADGRTYGQMTIGKALNFNNAKGGKTLNEYDSKSTKAAEAKDLQSFSLTHVSELLQEPKPLTWTLRDFLLPESLGFIIGPPASGKSLVALDWAACIATGIDWHGRTTSKGAVIYLAGEGHFGIRRRLMAWQIHNKVDLKNAPLAVSDLGASLTDGANVASVIKAIDAFSETYQKPSLIVVDTLHRNLGPADENSAADMAVYFNNLDAIRSRFQCSIVTVHHSGHLDPDRGRGSSSIRAAVDSEFQVKPSAGGVLTISCNKMKDAPKPSQISFQITQAELPWIDAEGNTEVSVTISPTNEQGASPGKRMPQSLKYGITTLFKAISEIGCDGRSFIDDWRQVFYAGHTGENDEAKRKAFTRCRTNLVDGGVVTVEDNFYKFTDCGSASWTDAHGFVVSLNFETGHRT